MKRYKHTLSAILVSFLAFSITSFSEQHADVEYEEALLMVDVFHRKVTVQRLDGTTTPYDLPMPLARHIPSRGWDVTPWGKIVYAGAFTSWFKRAKGVRRISRDDGRARSFIPPALYSRASRQWCVQANCLQATPWISLWAIRAANRPWSMKRRRR